MKCLLCRVMTFVFLFNCLTPTMGWGQTSRRSNTASLDRQINTQMQQAQKNLPATLYAQADQAVRDAHEKCFARADSASYVKGSTNEYSMHLQEAEAIQPCSVRWERMYELGHTPFEAVARHYPAEDFIKKVEKGELEFEDLVEYADPMDPAIENNHPELIAYAAEVIGNTIGQLDQLDPSQYDEEALQETLAQTEARLAYRLAFLGTKVPSYIANPSKEKMSSTGDMLRDLSSHNSISTQRIMAVGTLRTTLLRIHKFYKAKNLPDPAEEYQKQQLAQRIKKQQSQPLKGTLGEGSKTLNGAKMSQATIEQLAAEMVNEHGNLARFQQDFIDELKQAVAQKPDEGSQEYRDLQLLAEYATTYAMEYKPEALRDIVKIFDDGAKHYRNGDLKTGKFHRTYSPILNAIFTVIFENVRYNSLTSEQTKKILNLLTEFSDPEQYSLPTRVFSLEAASLLYRPHNNEVRNYEPWPELFSTLGIKPSDMLDGDTYYEMPPAKSYEEWKANMERDKKSVKRGMRALFANRVADIYYPLTQANYDDYGLSSDEMQKLADKLAYMYDGFYSISQATFQDPKDPNTYDKHYPSSSSKIMMKNEPNRVKKNAEREDAICEFTWEVIFWVYGGELFNFVGTAYRLTRGATVALPKAYKAFKSAGTLNAVKAGRFGQALKRGRTGLNLAGKEISNGAKFSNFVGKNISQQGYTIEFLTRQAPSKTAVRAASSVEAQATYQPVNSWRALQGKGSRWNPKNWFGSPQQEIVGMRVTRMEPGFKITQGEMRFGEMVNGKFVEQPISGFKSMGEVNRAFGQLMQADGSRFIYQTKPYWTAIQDWNQVQFEQRMLAGLQQALKNQTNSLMSMENVALEGGQVGKANHWWNLTQWGKPQQVVGDIGSVPLYITPKTPLEWARGLAQQVQAPNLRASLASTFPGLYSGSTVFPSAGIANVPKLLPGFYTTGMDLATGNTARQMFNSFFRPMNWNVTPMSTQLISKGGKWARRWQSFSAGVKHTFLPDYIPTANFWKFAGKNPILGAQLVPTLLWRNRFAATTTFFGLWMGADYVIYPFYRGWMESEATKEANQAIAQYGDTFSPERAKMDELLYQDLGVDLSDKRAMTTYQDVSAAQPDQPDGTLITAPIVSGWHTLGKTQVGQTLGIELPFFNEGARTDLAIQAHRANLNHAALVKTFNQVKANEKAAQEWQQAQKEALEQDEQAVLKEYAAAFKLKPQLKNEVHQIYEAYTQELLNAQTQEDVEQAGQRFEQKIGAVLTRAQQVYQDAYFAEYQQPYTEETYILEQARSITQIPEQYTSSQITAIKNMYGDLITPAAEEQLRAIFNAYVQACGDALKSADPVEQLKIVEQQQFKQLQEIMEKLAEEYWNGGYGPNFDPDAGEQAPAVPGAPQ